MGGSRASDRASERFDRRERRGEVEGRADLRNIRSASSIEGFAFARSLDNRWCALAVVRRIPRASVAVCLGHLTLQIPLLGVCIANDSRADRACKRVIASPRKLCCRCKVCGAVSVGLRYTRSVVHTRRFESKRARARARGIDQFEEEGTRFAIDHADRSSRSSIVRGPIRPCGSCRRSLAVFVDAFCTAIEVSFVSHTLPSHSSSNSDLKMAGENARRLLLNTADALHRCDFGPRASYKPLRSRHSRVRTRVSRAATSVRIAPSSSLTLGKVMTSTRLGRAFRES